MLRLFFVFFLSSIALFQLQAQSDYEKDMKAALSEWDFRNSNLDYENLANEFYEIYKANKNQWLPKYYSMLMQTLAATEKDAKQAIEISNRLEKEYLELEKLNPDQDEILVLRGMFRTLKVAKDPETYRMTLSSGVLWDFNEALKINPNNPRATYLSAYFNMQSAPFWESDPKRYCSSMVEAKELFAKENKPELEPQWGEFQVEEILKSVCN